LLFPTLIGWGVFQAADPGRPGLNVVAQLTYGAGILVQLVLPLVCLWRFGHGRPGRAAPGGWDLPLGLGFGLVAGAGAVGLYYWFLRSTPLFAESAVKVHARLAEFGLDSPGGFAVFAFFIAVVHSLLEEYYWRWFVFGRLSRRTSLGVAAALASAAFMAPHVFALSSFLGGEYPGAVLVFTLCVGIGGAFWAWLYWRSGSLVAPWLSHLVVDAALFVVGYDLFFVR
jgi:membrane protease YdiL (CAAX protease family)